MSDNPMTPAEKAAVISECGLYRYRLKHTED